MYLPPKGAWWSEEIPWFHDVQIWKASFTHSRIAYWLLRRWSSYEVPSSQRFLHSWSSCWFFWPCGVLHSLRNLCHLHGTPPNRIQGAFRHWKLPSKISTKRTIPAMKLGPGVRLTNFGQQRCLPKPISRNSDLKNKHLHMHLYIVQCLTKHVHRWVKDILLWFLKKAWFVLGTTQVLGFGWRKDEESNFHVPLWKYVWFLCLKATCKAKIFYKTHI